MRRMSRSALRAPLLVLCAALAARAQAGPAGQPGSPGAPDQGRLPASAEPADLGERHVDDTNTTSGPAGAGSTAHSAASLGSLGAHDAVALFADANSAFLSGDASRAIAAYEALVAEGTQSPELETNLGVSYLRQGRRGLAALHFERALFLDPGDDDARTDLADVRRGNVDKLEGESEEGGSEALVRFLAPLPGGFATALLLLGWTLGFVLLALRLTRARPYLGIAAIGCFVLAAIGAAIALGAAAGRDLALQRGVVVAQAAVAREGPNLKATSPFEVHEGTTLRIQDEESGFRRVKLANGLTGWIPAGAVELVVPPGWAGRPILAAR